MKQVHRRRSWALCYVLFWSCGGPPSGASPTTQHRDAKAPRSEAEAPRSEAEAPRSEAEAPRSEAEATEDQGPALRTYPVRNSRFKSGEAFALVDPRARLYLHPRTTSNYDLPFDRGTNSTSAWNSGQAIVFRWIRWVDTDWALLQTLPQIAKAEHCQQTIREFDRLKLDFYVQRKNLLPLVTQPVTQHFENGSELQLRPGILPIPIKDQKGSYRVLQSTLEVQVELEAEQLGLLYQPVAAAPRQPVEGTLRHKLRYLYGDKKELAVNECVSYPYHSSEMDAGHGFVKTTEGCIELRLQTDLKALKASKPKAKLQPKARRAGKRNLLDANLGKALTRLNCSQVHTFNGYTGSGTVGLGVSLGGGLPKARFKSVRAGDPVVLKNGQVVGRVAVDHNVRIRSGDCTTSHIARQPVCYPAK